LLLRNSTVLSQYLYIVFCEPYWMDSFTPKTIWSVYTVFKFIKFRNFEKWLGF
jgi:hypothetical protein